MTKSELVELLEYFDDDDVVDEYTLNRLMRDLHDGHEALVEEMEECQHQSGMYVQQDMIALRYFER